MQFKLARAALAAALLSTAAGALISQGGRQVAAADAAVTMQDFAFVPATVTVAAGGTVQWTNMQAGVQHTVTADDGSFDSGRLSTGQTFNMTFTRAGSFTYHCSVHPSLMMGTIVVTAAATSGGAAASPTGASSANAGTSAGRSVTFRAGYNMIGVPTGTAVNADSVLAFDPQANGYTNASSASLKGGQGYWAFFSADTTVSLPAGSDAPVATAAAARVWQLVGNPSGTKPALITGADQAFTFDQTTNAYAAGTMLQPGQGAWVLSSSGGTITISPGATAAATPSPTPVPTAQAAPVSQPAPVTQPLPVTTPRPNPNPMPNPYSPY